MNHLVNSNIQPTVRPTLEYRIPRISSLVVNSILGDEKCKNLALSELDSCEREFRQKYQTTPLNTGDIDSQTGILCSLLKVYLRSLLEKWVSYVDTIYHSTNRRVTELILQLRDGDATTKDNIRDALDSFMIRMREMEVPCVQRPPAFVDSYLMLREMYANEESRQGVKKVLIPQTIEFKLHLHNTQIEVAKKFVSQMRMYLRQQTKKCVQYE